MKSKSCCYNCKFRRIGCHKSCLQYKEYLKRLDTIKENKNKERILNARRYK